MNEKNYIPKVIRGHGYTSVVNWSVQVRTSIKDHEQILDFRVPASTLTENNITTKARYLVV